ncbi:unnamed protein product [Ectocarpus sp. 12 AP-2014]
MRKTFDNISEIKCARVLRATQMSVVAKYVAPALIVVPSLGTLYSSRPSVSGTSAFAKGSVALAVSVALQLLFVRRCALGGKPSNLKGLFALIYPAFVTMSLTLTLILFKTGGGPARLGVGANSLVNQYRLSDVIDRVRNIVGERTSSDDFRER